jgi:hypothetical protein
VIGNAKGQRWPSTDPNPEAVVAKVPQVKALVGQGAPRVDAIRQISVTESFNAKRRDECLSKTLSGTLGKARKLLEDSCANGALLQSAKRWQYLPAMIPISTGSPQHGIWRTDCLARASLSTCSFLKKPARTSTTSEWKDSASRFLTSSLIFRPHLDLTAVDRAWLLLRQHRTPPRGRAPPRDPAQVKQDPHPRAAMPMLRRPADYRRDNRTSTTSQSTARPKKGRRMTRAPDRTKPTSIRRRCHLRIHHNGLIQLSMRQELFTPTKYCANHANAKKPPPR